MAFYSPSPYGAPYGGFAQPAQFAYGGFPQQQQFSNFFHQGGYGGQGFGGIGVPIDMQPLQYRQQSTAQQLFSNSSPQFASLFNPTQPAQLQAQQFVQPQQLVAQPGRAVYAAPVVPVAAAGARPVDIYASAASVASAISQHSMAHSVASVHSHAGSVHSQASYVSAPSQFAAAARQARRRNTQYGKWKDSMQVYHAIPQIKNRMPDPLQNPKRTSFRKWKDMQDIFGRLGLQ